jgi:hypothetical protein
MQRTRSCLRRASDARAQLASHAPAAQTLYRLPAQKRWRKPELRPNPLTWTMKKRGAQPPQRKTRSTSPVSKSICAYMALFGALSDIGEQILFVYPEATCLFNILHFNCALGRYPASHRITILISIWCKFHLQFASRIRRKIRRAYRTFPAAVCYAAIFSYCE